MEKFRKKIEEFSNLIETTKINIINKKTINIDKEDIDKLENNKNFIYVVTASAQKEKLYDCVVEKFKKLKNKKFKTCGINKKHFDKFDYENLVLYVGSSQKLKIRMKQHFDIYKIHNVYSLHLSKNTYMDLFSNIKIHIFEFDNDIEIVKTIESYLWKELKPLLGQRNNK